MSRILVPVEIDIVRAPADTAAKVLLEQPRHELDAPHHGASAGLRARAGWPHHGASPSLRRRAGRPEPGSYRGRGNPVGGWWTKDRMQHAADRLVKEGHLSPMGAAGLVARWAAVEASGGPGSVNPSSGAEGIAQWLGDRKGDGSFGSFDEQLSHAIHELNGPEATAAAALRSASTPAEAARGASMFERAKGYNPSTGEDAYTGRTPVERVFRDINGGGGETGGASDVAHRLSAARDAGLITNEECVALATASVGIPLGSNVEGGHVGDWRRGAAASEGNIVPGTPLATFLDRNGNTGNTYAIGGNGGQRGAHLDHAGVFEGYIRDAQGKPIGMNMSEQYRGSGGTHSRAYYFGDGWGEGDASNYYAIDVAGGGHLGGSANPMSNRDARSEYHDAAVRAAKQ